MMAHFIKIEDEWLNLDMMSKVYYEGDINTTFVLSGSAEFAFDGNHVAEILNATSEPTMHDKLVCKYLADKLKSPLSLIVAKLDSITKSKTNKV